MSGSEVRYAEPGGGRCVVVTGASSGMGRSIATGLARAGFHVLAGVRQDRDAAALEAEGIPGLEPTPLDVTREVDLDRLAARLAGASQGLFGLVNNAGVSKMDPVEEVPLETLRLHLEVNCVGVVALTQRLLPALRRGAGRIINNGSIACFFATPLLGAYSMSKHALAAFSDTLRRELAPDGIPVSLLETGAVETPIWDKVRPTDGGEGRYGPLRQAIERARQSRRGNALSPERVGDLVLEILTCDHPRTRYAIGSDVTWRRRLARLPDSWQDRAVALSLRGGR